MPSPRFTWVSAAVIYSLSAVAWTHGYLLAPYRFHTREAWLYLALFLVPGGVVLISLRILAHERWWRKLLGVVILLPCIAFWLGSLLLASNGFRIH